MYSDIPVWLSLLFILGGLVALAWSSDVFVDGAAGVARKLGISPFIIGMVIIGFGTCAPEFFVSIFSGASGHANLSLGNAYGSCIFNVAGILGISALITPLAAKRSLSWAGAPLMIASALFSMWLLRDRTLGGWEGLGLLAFFAVAMPIYCWFDQKFGKGGADAAEAPSVPGLSNGRIAFDLLVGLTVMVAASHFLVWGSVDLARTFGVDELLIGLTIVAIGTSVPELATAIAAARKGEAELVLGNIAGSNLFNVLVVVGTAGVLSPEPIRGFSPYVITRDLPMLLGISVTVFLFAVNWRKPKQDGVISRWEGTLWLVSFIVYTVVMVMQEMHG